MSQIHFHCPKTHRYVVLTRTEFGGVSGIGDENPGPQVEHACSIEGKCPRSSRRARFAGTMLARKCSRYCL